MSLYPIRLGKWLYEARMLGELTKLSDQNIGPLDSLLYQLRRVSIGLR
jgi:hypothetical protein